MSGAFTNADGKFFICTTPQPEELDQAGYEALDWVEVGNVGQLPDSGTTDNIVNYPTIDTEVTPKSKGIADAGGGTLELARLAGDAGQVALRAAAATKYIYATKRELPDNPDDDSTPTVYYNRGLISGPFHPGGGNEDFVLERFTLAYVQREIVVNTADINAPTNTLLPSISGIAQVGETLTALPGTWTGDPTLTYQWQEDNAGDGIFVNITGATSKTYDPVVGSVGNALRVAVTGTNSAGNATANSAPTQVLLAA